MSALGSPPAYHRTPPSQEPPSRVPVWVVLLILVPIIALGGYGAKTLLHEGKHPSERTYPAAWDARIAPYVKIAERKRGLEFLHPVAVRFLPPAQFEKTVTTDEKKLDDQDRTELKQAVGLLRALGLIRGDVDLLHAINDAKGGAVLAYYSFDDERVTVRGRKVTPAVRATLVHELTHVLQDQHFNIGDRMKKLEKASDKGPSSVEADVLQAIVEGDAERVATKYRESLNARQRRALDSGETDDLGQAQKRLAKVPKVVVTMMSSPYVLGEPMVQMVAEDGGNSAVDDLLSDAPKHETSLLDPFTVLQGDTGAADVAVPGLGDGEKKFDSGELGTLTWYFMLAERLPLTDALDAADGWDGDAYVAYTKDGTSCARMDFAGRTGADTSRMGSALRRWVDVAPGSSARVSTHGDVVRLDSCDPGKAAGVGKDASEDAMTLVAVRSYLGIGLVKGGAPDKMARCLSDRLVHEYPVSKLRDPQFGANDPSVKARIQQLAVGCR